MNAWPLALSLVLAAPALAEQRALLVGVSAYAPEVRALAPPLTGPGNDVALLASTLRAEWPDARLAILTDRPDLLDPAERAGTGAPNRAAILAALESLAAEAGPGDEVFLYFSGHGAQASVSEGSDEADGLEEVFLPADFTLHRRGDQLELENTLADDLLGDFAARIVRRGAFLWLVIDACHSGSMLRTGTGATPRRVDFSGAGAARVVDLTPRAAEGTALDALAPVNVPVLGAGSGGGVAGFFAAPPGALAYEMPFETDNGASRVHGALTWGLVAALRAEEARSYGDLARALAARIWRLGGSPEPVFAGDLAARPMLGAATGEVGPRRAALVGAADGLYVRAGRIDGLAPGGWLPVRRVSDGATLFTAEVVAAGIDRARLRLPTESPVLDAALRAEGLDPARYRDRWLADRAADLAADLPEAPILAPLTLALPDAAKTPAPLAEALRRLRATPGLVVTEGGGADLRVEVAADSVRLVTPEGFDAITPVPLSAGADAIATALGRGTRARALLAVGQAFADSDLARGLRVTLRRRPAPEALAAARPPAPCSPTGTIAPAGPADPLLYDGAALIRRGETRHCDLVLLEVTNAGPEAVDLSVFYLDPAGGTYFLDGYPGSELGGLRVPPGATRGLAYVEDLSGSAARGPVELMLLAVPADPGAPAPRDFRAVSDPPAAWRGGGLGMGGLLAAAGFGSPDRGAPEESPLGAAGAVIVPLVTVDGAEAGR